MMPETPLQDETQPSNSGGRSFVTETSPIPDPCRLQAEIATLRQRLKRNEATILQQGSRADRAILDRELAEQALRRNEKLALVGRLASSISHEINNPLESVVNLLYLIEHSGPAHSEPDDSETSPCDSATAEVRAYARLAASELQRVSRIVTQTLAFHRQSTEVQRTSMAAILESVLGLFQGRLSAAPVRLHRRMDPDDEVVCLPGDLRQVFANLVGNALDALDASAALDAVAALSAPPSAKRALWLRTRRSHNWATGEPGLRVTIADNGCGMTETTRKKLFEAFYTTKPNTGTGLGLWVSEGIIRSHGGRVQVRSSQTPGRSGTIFTIFFPATPPEPPQAQS